MSLVQKAREGTDVTIDDQPLHDRFRAACTASEHGYEAFALSVMDGAWPYLPQDQYDQLFITALNRGLGQLLETLLKADHECKQPRLVSYASWVQEWVEAGNQKPVRLLQKHPDIMEECRKSSGALDKNWSELLVKARILGFEDIADFIDSVVELSEDDKTNAARELRRQIDSPTDKFSIPDSANVDSRRAVYRNLFEHYDIGLNEEAAENAIIAGSPPSLKAFDECKGGLPDVNALSLCVAHEQTGAYEYLRERPYIDEKPLTQARHALQSNKPQELREAVRQSDTNELGGLLMKLLSQGDDLIDSAVERFRNVSAKHHDRKQLLRQALFALFDQRAISISNYRPYFDFFDDRLPLNETIRGEEGWGLFLGQMVATMDVSVIEQSMRLLPLNDGDRSLMLNYAGVVGVFVDNRAQVNNFLFDQGAKPNDPSQFADVATSSEYSVRRRWLDWFQERDKLEALPDLQVILKTVMEADHPFDGFNEAAREILNDTQKQPLCTLIEQLCEYNLPVDDPRAVHHLLYDQRNEKRDFDCTGAMVILSNHGIQPGLNLLKTIYNSDNELYEQLAENLNEREINALQASLKTTTQA